MMKWSNPHAWIYIDVAGADGKVVNWALETGGANTLFRRGWRKEDLPAGTVLVVDGWQARNGTPTANAHQHHVPRWAAAVRRLVQPEGGGSGRSSRRLLPHVALEHLAPDDSAVDIAAGIDARHLRRPNARRASTPCPR